LVVRQKPVERAGVAVDRAHEGAAAISGKRGDLEEFRVGGLLGRCVTGVQKQPDEQRNA
jgi:hypothetical protein